MHKQHGDFRALLGGHKRSISFGGAYRIPILGKYPHMDIHFINAAELQAYCDLSEKLDTSQPRGFCHFTPGPRSQQPAHLKLLDPPRERRKAYGPNGLGGEAFFHSSR